MKTPRTLVATTALMLAAAALHAAPGDQPVKPLPPAATDAKTVTKTQTLSVPARGLFQGDRLTESAQLRLAELIVNAVGLQVDVALLVPVGPWKIDPGSSATDENALTPARLQAVKRYLTERGIDPKHIYVESRVDEKLKEPRLDVQIAGRPSAD
jgi:OOP family OmpA-OmpF porin